VAKGEGETKPRFNVIESLRDLLHDLRLVRNALEAQIERIDRLEYEIKALVRGSGAGAGPFGGSTPVAHNLMIDSQPDGSVRFAIDGGKSFTLPPRLAEVFLFLASGEKGASDDDALVGWRSRTEISAFQGGRRKALRTALYNPKLIQTHRQKGVRLAYKRGEPVFPLARMDAKYPSD